jgi:chromate reductase
MAYKLGYIVGSLAAQSMQQSLRSVLSFCNSPQMNAPEAYIQYQPDMFTSDGEVTDDTTAGFLRDFMEEFRQLIVRVLTVIPRQS